MKYYIKRITQDGRQYFDVVLKEWTKDRHYTPGFINKRDAVACIELNKLDGYYLSYEKENAPEGYCTSLKEVQNDRKDNKFKECYDLLEQINEKTTYLKSIISGLSE